MPRGTHMFDFGRYKGKTVEEVRYDYNTNYETLYETIILVFSDGEVLEIYSEDFQFEHTTVEGEDS